MRRGKPVSLKTCENNLQANKTKEVKARIIRKTFKPNIKLLTARYCELNRTRLGVRIIKGTKHKTLTHYQFKRIRVGVKFWRETGCKPTHKLSIE